MPCCSRKKTEGKDPQSFQNESDQISEKIKVIPLQQSSNPSEIDYSITVKTGDNRNSNTNGPVYIKIFGRDDKLTDDILLPSPFKQNSIRKLSIKAIDIGKPQRLIIRHEDQTSEWFVDYVEISVHNFLIRFVANRWLSENKHDRKLSAELFATEQPAMDYNIEVRTGNEQVDSFDSPIYIQIFGTTTNTPKVFLESKYASFKSGSSTKFPISTNNVGEIQRVILGHENLGTVNEWHLEKVHIQANNQEYEFLVNKWLSPTKELFVELDPQALPPVVEKEEDEEKESIYFVTIKVDDIQRLENILLNIYGSTGDIEKILSKDKLQSIGEDNLGELQIEHEDIGNIESLSIAFNDAEERAALLFAFIDIKYQDISYHFLVGCCLSNHLGPNTSRLEIKPITSENKIDYKLLIEIDEKPKGTSVDILLCIYGDEDVIKNYLLRVNNEEKKSRLEFDLEGIDVGKIEKINVGIETENDELKRWIESMEIQKDDEHYLFKIDQIETSLDLFPEKLKSPLAEVILPEQAVYTIIVMTSTEEESGTDSGVLMTIYGDRAQTKEFLLTSTNESSETLFRKGAINQFEVELIDVGNIKKIKISQDGKGLHPIWHLQTVEIQKGTEIYKFHADQILDYSTLDIYLIPIPSVIEKFATPEPSLPPSTPPEKNPPISETTVSPSTSTPAPQIKRSETSFLKTVAKTKDIDYQIKTITGDRTFDNNITIRIRGELGTIAIPLSKTKTGAKPFQANATDVFTTRTTDVGKIKRLVIEQEEAKENHSWNLKKILLTKGNQSYKFNNNLYLDDKQPKLALYPLDEKRDDYVQSELRRLRQSLRSESAKMRRPTHKAHEPYVYNDLKPYFDTKTVERAIQEPLESQPGYYTRLTALRIVEPWEAYGMDYGVSYEFLKKRRSRTASTKRSNKQTDQSIDRTQGSTYLPEYPRVNIQKPAEYQRDLTHSDVSKIRSFVRNRYTSQARNQVDKDYKRTRDDFYRMQLDNIAGYHESNRENMLRTYHSYLQNTPGSKKALRDLCEQIPSNATKTTIEEQV